MVSIQELRTKTSRKKSEELYLSLLRKISIYPLKLFIYLGITPGQVTFSWIILYIITTIFFLIGKYEFLIAAILIKIFGDILDTTDGAIARFSGKGNFKGVYLEIIAHHLIHPYMFLAISLGVFNITKNILFLYAGIIAALNLCMMELVLTGKELVILKRATKSQIEESNKEKSITFLGKIHQILMGIFVALHSFILYFFVIINRLDIFIMIVAIYPIPLILIRISYDYINNLGMKSQHYEFKK